jgi:hypothetical protein
MSSKGVAGVVVAGWVGIVCLVLAGCTIDSYTVEMRAVEGGFERRLEWKRSTGGGGSPTSEEEVARLAGAYGQEGPARARTLSLSGRFVDQTPGDIGGSGTLTATRTTLGASLVYFERFRGEPDLVKLREEQGAAVDALVDLVIGWLEAEIGGEAGFAELRAWADGELRRDCHNLALQVWSALAATSLLPAQREPEEEERVVGADAAIALRALSHLRERGYMEPGEVHTLLTSWSNGAKNLEAAEPPVKIARRAVAKRLGVDADDTTGRLAFFASREKATESWERYLASPAASKLLARWEVQRPRAAVEDESEPDPGDVVADMMVAAAGMSGFLLNHDSVTVRLHCATQPLVTNGRWDGAASVVEWTFDVDESPGEPRGIPMTAHAQWVEPAREFQIEHFGREILAGERLARYCAWRSGLSGDDGRPWDAAITALQPGPGLRAAVEAIALPPGSTADPAPGIELILEALADGN